MDQSTAEVIGFLVGWAIAVLVGWAIGRGKGRSVEGALWGLLLGAIGWIIIACRSKTPEKQAREIAAVQAMLHPSPYYYAPPPTVLPALPPAPPATTSAPFAHPIIPPAPPAVRN